MNRLKAKLKSSTGMSLVFALVIFIMVTVFSATMVGGALTAVRNAGLHRGREQLLLAARSAEKLFLTQTVDGGGEYCIKKVEIKDDEPYPAEPNGYLPDIQNENLQAHTAANAAMNRLRNKYEMDVSEEENSVYLLCTKTVDSGTVTVEQTRFSPSAASEDDPVFLYAICSVLASADTEAERSMTFSAENMPDTELTISKEAGGKVAAEFSIKDTDGSALYSEKIVLACIPLFSSETVRAYYSYNEVLPAVFSRDDSPLELEPEIERERTGFHTFRIETTEYRLTVDGVDRNGG